MPTYTDRGTDDALWFPSLVMLLSGEAPIDNDGQSGKTRSSSGKHLSEPSSVLKEMA
jgi:hypothetical protein